MINPLLCLRGRHVPLLAKRTLATPILVPNVTRKMPSAEGITAASICAPATKSAAPLPFNELQSSLATRTCDLDH